MTEQDVDAELKWLERLLDWRKWWRKVLPSKEVVIGLSICLGIAGLFGGMIWLAEHQARTRVLCEDAGHIIGVPWRMGDRCMLKCQSGWRYANEGALEKTCQ